jgi:hypothetical protein
LSHHVQNPFKRNDLVITGTNFGVDKSKVVVKLVQNDNDPSVQPREYELYIPDDITDTQITARVSGGRSGTYDLRVLHTDRGLSLPTEFDDFEFRVIVKSVTPNTGSKAGGTLLTIKGHHFLPRIQDVFVGEGVNWMCEIVSELQDQLDDDG